MTAVSDGIKRILATDLATGAGDLRQALTDFPESRWEVSDLLKQMGSFHDPFIDTKIASGRILHDFEMLELFGVEIGAEQRSAIEPVLDAARGALAGIHAGRAGNYGVPLTQLADAADQVVAALRAGT